MKSGAFSISLNVKDIHVSETFYENPGFTVSAGIKWLIGNTEGWANFLACLKAWMEYGINLRKGAFDFMK